MPNVQKKQNCYPGAFADELLTEWQGNMNRQISDNRQVSSNLNQNFRLQTAI
jgi:hypothetical protein